jgi:hypothetical protein
LSAVIGRSAPRCGRPCVYCPVRTMGEPRSSLLSLWFSARAVRCFHQPAKTFLILAPCGEQRRPWTVRSPPSSRLLSPFTHQSDERASDRLFSLSVGLVASPSRVPSRSLSLVCALCMCAITATYYIFTQTYDVGARVAFAKCIP